MAATVDLLGYTDLYALAERQQWSAQAIDLAQDRRDWEERLTGRQRDRRLAGLAAFFVGEERVATELGPMMRACPREDMRLFLCTQIGDEARHARLFDRFHEEVAGQGDGTGERLARSREHVGAAFSALFDGMLAERVNRLAVAPDDLGSLVEAVTIYHMVIEGMLGVAMQQFLVDTYNRHEILPGLVSGLELVARDEHRHIAFGARFLADVASGEPRHSAAVRRVLAEAAPLALDAMSEAIGRGLGQAGAQTRAFAERALERRMTAIGLPLSP